MVHLLDNSTSVLGNIIQDNCKSIIGTNLRSIALYMLFFFFTVFLCNVLHTLFRPFSQPRIMSEFLVGLCLTNLPFIRRGISTPEIIRTLNYVADFGMVCHMFVLGLEIDHRIFIHPPIRETKAACTGTLSTFILAIIVTHFLHVVPNAASSTKFNLSLSIILSGTASPLLMRLITDLKIGKSDIGRFVVSTGVQSDLISTLLLSVGFLIFDPMKGYKLRDTREIFKMVSLLVIETVVAANLSPLIMNWVNNQNPEGKPMKGSHLIISVAYVVLVCSSSPTTAGFNSILSAFLAGLFMPREGRISKMMISKVNYFLTTIFNPVFFIWVGVEADLTEFEGNRLGTWARLFFLFLIATVGKVVGTLVSGVMLGFHWPEAVAIGLLLNIKGHFHVYLAIIAAKNQITTLSTSMSILCAIFLTVVYTPLVVANIINRARKRSPTQRMALQWLDPTTELRILLCLRGSQNLRSAINFIELSRGVPDPGISVYVTDMVELTDKIAATLDHGGAVTDAGVVEMRNEVTRAVEGYVAEAEEGEGGVGVKRMVTVATLNNMHQDVCILAEDLMISLIVMPFHKEDQMGDGRLGVGHSGFRHVNRKVLRHAPCSVGILVDRGLGSITNISRSTVFLNVAAIFIGGKDDREVLAYAGRVARHTGVKLTVIRFLLEANSEDTSTSTRPGRPRVNTPEQDEEMKLDDECFTDFYDRHVARGRVAYMEKYLVNSGQTFSTLRAMEGQYGLFVVGRGGRVNSVLTVGMNDWEECPELGPIGDILSASDFSVTASVLIIQQHSLRGELAGLDDEFSIM